LGCEGLLLSDLQERKNRLMNIVLTEKEANEYATKVKAWAIKFAEECMEVRSRKTSNESAMKEAALEEGRRPTFPTLINI
jgi:hypothetical protein